MILPLSEDFRIEQYAHGWSIQKRRVVSTGKDAGRVVWDAIAHYGSLPAAVECCRTPLLNNWPGDDLDEAMAEVAAIAAAARRRIEDLL